MAEENTPMNEGKKPELSKEEEKDGLDNKQRSFSPLVESIDSEIEDTHLEEFELTSFAEMLNATLKVHSKQVKALVLIGSSSDLEVLGDDLARLGDTVIVQLHNNGKVDVVTGDVIKSKTEVNNRLSLFSKLTANQIHKVCLDEELQADAVELAKPVLGDAYLNSSTIQINRDFSSFEIKDKNVQQRPTAFARSIAYTGIKFFWMAACMLLVSYIMSIVYLNLMRPTSIDKNISMPFPIFEENVASVPSVYIEPTTLSVFYDKTFDIALFLKETLLNAYKHYAEVVHQVAQQINALGEKLFTH